MKSDITKILTESRPRRTRSRYHDTRRQETAGDPDLLPKHQGISRPYAKGWQYTPTSLENIGPSLRRFLLSSTRRRWDDVYHDICLAVRGNRTVARSILDQVEREVHLHVFRDRANTLKIRHNYSHWTLDPYRFWVHPETGILMAPPTRPRSRAQATIRLDDSDWVRGEDGVLYPVNRGPYRSALNPRLVLDHEIEAVFIGGIWFWVLFDDVPRVLSGTPPMVHLGRYIRVTGLTDFVTGQTVTDGRYRAGKRQMNSDDLRRLGLRNAHTPHD